MDSPFEEWVKSTAEDEAVRKYGGLLVELGASWASFVSRDPGCVTMDLLQGGIPILAARQIVDVVRRTVQRNHAPMAIFWHLRDIAQNATNCSCDCSKLKKKLQAYGELAEFRLYANVSCITQHDRFLLQLAGCQLVDCSESAVNMVLVDVMDFALKHPGGATLCFVTDDGTDFTYLLNVLQRFKQYRTVVVSKKTTSQVMLSGDLNICWETDILGLPYEHLPMEHTNIQQHDENPASAGVNDPIALLTELHVDEDPIDDTILLRNVIQREISLRGCARKCNVGNILRQTYPVRFHKREIVKEFLATAISSKVVVESGKGAFKMLAVPPAEASSSEPALSPDSQPQIIIPVVSGTPPRTVAEAEACFLCRSVCDDVKLVPLSSTDGSRLCPECVEWSTTPVDQKDMGAEKIAEHLEFMAFNDDILVDENTMKTQVQLKTEFHCASPKLAALWIQHAHATRKIKLVDNVPLVLQTRQRQFCLSLREVQIERFSPPPAEFETKAEEDCILQLLWDSTEDWINRLDAIAALRAAFPYRMSHPFYRSKVMLNGQNSQKFFLAKGPYAHVIGLTSEAAAQGLATFRPGKAAEDTVSEETSVANSLSEISLDTDRSDALSTTGGQPDTEEVVSEEASNSLPAPVDDGPVLESLRPKSTAAPDVASSLLPFMAASPKEDRRLTTALFPMT